MENPDVRAGVTRRGGVHAKRLPEAPGWLPRAARVRPIPSPAHSHQGTHGVTSCAERKRGLEDKGRTRDQFTACL